MMMTMMMMMDLVAQKIDSGEKRTALPAVLRRDTDDVARLLARSMVQERKILYCSTSRCVSFSSLGLVAENERLGVNHELYWYLLRNCCAIPVFQRVWTLRVVNVEAFSFLYQSCSSHHNEKEFTPRAAAAVHCQVK